MLLELRFPPDYPAHPPFVRVLAPRFLMRTGHVTVRAHAHAYTVRMCHDPDLNLTPNPNPNPNPNPILTLPLTLTLTLARYTLLPIRDGQPFRDAAG